MTTDDQAFRQIVAPLREEGDVFTQVRDPQLRGLISYHLREAETSRHGHVHRRNAEVLLAHTPLADAILGLLRMYPTGLRFDHMLYILKHDKNLVYKEDDVGMLTGRLEESGVIEPGGDAMLRLVKLYEEA